MLRKDLLLLDLCRKARKKRRRLALVVQVSEQYQRLQNPREREREREKERGRGREGGCGRGKCFYCGEKGHWKRNCPEYLARRVQGMIESHVIEVSFITDTSNNWCIDSGATNHIYNSLQGFRSTRKCSDGEVMLTLGSSITVSAVAIEAVVL